MLWSPGMKRNAVRTSVATSIHQLLAVAADLATGSAAIATTAVIIGVIHLKSFLILKLDMENMFTMWDKKQLSCLK